MDRKLFEISLLKRKSLMAADIISVELHLTELDLTHQVLSNKQLLRVSSGESFLTSAGLHH